MIFFIFDGRKKNKIMNKRINKKNTAGYFVISSQYTHHQPSNKSVSTFCIDQGDRNIQGNERADTLAQQGVCVYNKTILFPLPRPSQVKQYFNAPNFYESDTEKNQNLFFNIFLFLASGLFQKVILIIFTIQYYQKLEKPP